MTSIVKSTDSRGTNHNYENISYLVDSIQENTLKLHHPGGKNGVSQKKLKRKFDNFHQSTCKIHECTVDNQDAYGWFVDIEAHSKNETQCNHFWGRSTNTYTSNCSSQERRILMDSNRNVIHDDDDDDVTWALAADIIDEVLSTCDSSFFSSSFNI